MTPDMLINTTTFVTTQHRTLWKAQRLGYVTDDGEQRLTDKGREYIAKANAEARTDWSNPDEPRGQILR